MKTKLFFICLISSLLLRLSLTGVSALHSLYLAGWSFSFCYCIFTWYMLEYCEKKGDIGYFRTTIAIIIGFIILTLPVNIIDYRGSYASLMLYPITVASIILSAVCYNTKNRVAIILSAIIILLINTIAMSTWLGYCQDYLNLPNVIY